MKKRIISILLLSFLMVSLVVPVTPMCGENNNFKTESITVQENPIDARNIVVLDVMQEEKTETKSDFDIIIEGMNQEMHDIESIKDKKEWFAAYKNIIEKYSYILDPPETIYDYYTDEEIYYMWRCIETEVFDKGFDERVNVASVILNRINNDKFPDSPIDVITSTNQFAYWRTEITDDTILALEYAFEIGDTTNGSLFFHSNSWVETFNNAKYVFTDGANHHFYK